MLTAEHRLPVELKNKKNSTSKEREKNKNNSTSKRKRLGQGWNDGIWHMDTNNETNKSLDRERSKGGREYFHLYSCLQII